MSVRPVAMLSPEEFERARDSIPELSQHLRYEDWVACREGLLIGLSRCGLESRLVSISLDDFLLWCKARAAATERIGARRLRFALRVFWPPSGLTRPSRRRPTRECETVGAR